MSNIEKGRGPHPAVANLQGTVSWNIYADRSKLEALTEDDYLYHNYAWKQVDRHSGDRVQLSFPAEEYEQAVRVFNKLRQTGMTRIATSWI